MLSLQTLESVEASVCSSRTGGVFRLDAEILQVGEQDVDLSHGLVYTFLTSHLKQIETH